MLVASLESPLKTLNYVYRIAEFDFKSINSISFISKMDFFHMSLLTVIASRDLLSRTFFFFSYVVIRVNIVVLIQTS